LKSTTNNQQGVLVDNVEYNHENKLFNTHNYCYHKNRLIEPLVLYFRAQNWNNLFVNSHEVFSKAFQHESNHVLFYQVTGVIFSSSIEKVVQEGTFEFFTTKNGDHLSFGVFDHEAITCMIFEIPSIKVENVASNTLREIQRKCLTVNVFLKSPTIMEHKDSLTLIMSPGYKMTRAEVEIFNMSMKREEFSSSPLKSRVGRFSKFLSSNEMHIKASSQEIIATLEGYMNSLGPTDVHPMHDVFPGLFSVKNNQEEDVYLLLQPKLTDTEDKIAIKQYINNICSQTELFIVETESEVDTTIWQTDQKDRRKYIDKKQSIFGIDASEITGINLIEKGFLAVKPNFQSTTNLETIRSIDEMIPSIQQNGTFEALEEYNQMASSIIVDTLLYNHFVLDSYLIEGKAGQTIVGTDIITDPSRFLMHTINPDYPNIEASQLVRNSADFIGNK